MATDRIGRIALLWRGDRDARAKAKPTNNRLSPVFEALAAVNVAAEPAVYSDEMVDEVRDQLLRLDGVLVWVDPISDGRDRSKLDPMLREVGAEGVWVSAHPDVILKMGTKEVLFRTRHLGWGTDTYLYRSLDEFRGELPLRLASGPRVLKQNRGNGGIGTWKVELAAHDTSKVGLDTIVRVLHARRGSVEEDLRLGDFMSRCEQYFALNRRMIDQPFQPRLQDGMIRCYMVRDEVAGFGHQLVKALMPSPPGTEPAQPGPRIMYGASEPTFQALRGKMESQWVPALIRGSCGMAGVRNRLSVYAARLRPGGTEMPVGDSPWNLNYSSQRHGRTQPLRRHLPPRRAFSRHRRLKKANRARQKFD